MYNHSSTDVWYLLDDFLVKIPAGQRILCDGWNQVRSSVENMDQEEFYGCHSPVARCGFKFLKGDKLYIHNNLLIFSPESARASSYYGHCERTLEEHIALINTMKLERATIIAEDLSFLPRCPTLKYLSVYHARGMDQELDFSPLYEMPEIRSLSLAAPNMGLEKGPAIRLDFTRIRGLKQVAVHTNDRFNYSDVPGLERLFFSNDRRRRDLNGIAAGQSLKELIMIQCSIKSLDGIGAYPLQSVSLSYLRSLEDISALSECAGTLRCLSIDACGKIRDFSCLSSLNNLEFLHLTGSNTLPDLDFLNLMPNLKVFTFSMTVESGDLSPCLRLAYASCLRGKRHYNLKDSDLPKILDVSGFQLK